MAALKNVLILGGYGTFGRRIAAALAAVAGCRLYLAGRSLPQAQAQCDALRLIFPAAQLVPLRLDIEQADFVDCLAALNPFLVIHTSGPFQGQGYAVPQACLAVACHYLDLADDREYVRHITQFDAAARAKNVLLVSGASSVPGLSSAVIDHYLPAFSRLDEIDMAISPGNRADRGLATLTGILSATGRPMPVWQDGAWQTLWGWMSPRRLDFGARLGWRWAANVAVPDLDLFPQRYPTVQRVGFQAGLELAWLHWVMVAMAWWAKMGLIRNWAKYSKGILALSKLTLFLGSDKGGMRVQLRGLDLAGQAQTRVWYLSALAGIGPIIPAIASIILAKKLLLGQISQAGAMPCLGLFTLAEFEAEVTGLPIYFAEAENTV